MMIGLALFAIICSLLNGYMISKKCESKRTFFVAAEVVLNLVFVVIFIFGKDIDLLTYFDLFSINILMYLSVCDIIEMQLPLIAFAIYAIVGVIAALFGNFVSSVIFAVVIFGVLMIASKKSSESIGRGDVYALSCVALYNSTADTMSIIVVSLIISLIYGIVNSIIRKTGMKTMVAYMPFLLIAYYLIKIVY